MVAQFQHIDSKRRNSVQIVEIIALQQIRVDCLVGLTMVVVI
jgi:hypothetical protein